MKNNTKLIMLFILFYAQAGFCQFSRVEVELGEIQFERVAPLIKTLTENGKFLKSVDVNQAMVTSAGIRIAVQPFKSYKKVLSGPELYSQLKKSTVMFISNGLRATGTVLDQSGIVLTNYHVLQMFGDTLKKNAQPLLCMSADGIFYPLVSILSSSKINDLAIVKLDIGEAKLFALPMGEVLPEGSDVFAMGHPAHILYFFSKGIVAKNFIRDGNHTKPGEDFRMAITADYSLGESGGPIVDDKGNLVGLISAANALYGNPAQRSNPQMTVKSAIPIIAIKELIK